MNDDQLITAVREYLTGVRSATALERIVSRSRAVHAQRRIAAVSAALGARAAESCGHVHGHSPPEGRL